MKKLGLFTLLMLAGAAFAVIDTNPAISYSTPVIYGINVPITSNTPVNVGGQIDSFTIFYLNFNFCCFLYCRLRLVHHLILLLLLLLHLELYSCKAFLEAWFDLFSIEP